MKRIFYVPGKNPKPPPGPHRVQLLRCLQHGLRHIDSPASGDISLEDAFHLVSWNFICYQTYRNISADIPWLDELLEAEEHLPNDIREVQPLRYQISRFLYQVGDLFPWFIPLIPDRRIKSSIRETEIYFKNHDNIAWKIREVLKVPLRAAVENNDSVLLIAHSMGSIIAYDALWELEHLEGIHNCVDCLLTLGSPLGMRFVQKRLLSAGLHNRRRYPCNIRYWVNISSRGDLVALDPSLRDDFGEMLSLNCVESIEDMRKEVVNYFRDDKGINVHRSYGYLVNPHVSRVISDWWMQA